MKWKLYLNQLEGLNSNVFWYNNLLGCSLFAWKQVCSSMHQVLCFRFDWFVWEYTYCVIIHGFKGIWVQHVPAPLWITNVLDHHPRPQGCSNANRNKWYCSWQMHLHANHLFRDFCIKFVIEAFQMIQAQVTTSQLTKLLSYTMRSSYRGVKTITVTLKCLKLWTRSWVWGPG